MAPMAADRRGSILQAESSGVKLLTVRKQVVRWGGDGQAISCRFFSLAPALHRAIYKTAHPNDEDEEAEEHGEFSEGRNNLLRERYRIASRD